MENVVIELTINKWLLFVCFLIVWMSLYERYTRKKQENKPNEITTGYWQEYNR